MVRGEPFGTPDRVEGVHLGVRGGRSPARTSSRVRAVRRRGMGAPDARAPPRFVPWGRVPVAHPGSSPQARGPRPLLYVYLTAPEDVCARRRTEQAVALGRPRSRTVPPSRSAPAQSTSPASAPSSGATVDQRGHELGSTLSQAADAVRHILEAL